MIKYQVRSRDLLDIVGDLKNGRLIKSPYFQRNLVWREIHKIDFIKTILLGLPFPQIFIAKGEIDLDSMTTYSCVVDGQQRLTAIEEYVGGKLEVDGGCFDDLEKKEKENFLKYQVPIIDLDIHQHDPDLKEIFKRLNRTFYALSSIEKLSTEYATSDLMIVAKVLSDQLFIYDEDQNGELQEREVDPLIPKEIIKKCRTIESEEFKKLLLDNGVFSPHELSRKVHLNFTLNIISTCVLGWHNRNTGISRLLDNDKYTIDDYILICLKLNRVAAFVRKMRFKQDSYWLNKANLFSIIVLLYTYLESLEEIKPATAKKLLDDFFEKLPPDYSIAAKEAVNNKQERIVRHEYLEKTLFS